MCIDKTASVTERKLERWYGAGRAAYHSEPWVIVRLFCLSTSTTKLSDVMLELEYGW